jgi:hypothetical protein
LATIDCAITYIINTIQSKIEKHLILDDNRSMRSTQGRRPPTNDYEDVDIDNESQRI